MLRKDIEMGASTVYTVKVVTICLTLTLSDIRWSRGEVKGGNMQGKGLGRKRGFNAKVTCREHAP